MIAQDLTCLLLPSRVRAWCCQVHGDVFRPPAQLQLFCALVGTGSQLAAMVAVMILFATATTLYMGRGGIILSFLLVYCLTSVVAGYASGSLYSRSGGRSWIPTMLYTACLFPAVCFATALVLNIVGAAYGSLATLPLTSVLSVLLMWLLVALPLTVVGTILGRNWSGTPNDPCRVNAIPRLIPDKRWFARPPVLIALGGVLPFGSIFIEMYFVFTSFWNYKFYCAPPRTPPPSHPAGLWLCPPAAPDRPPSLACFLRVRGGVRQTCTASCSLSSSSSPSSPSA